MEVIDGPGHCPDDGAGAVVTIGAFDGVHLGHRAVIDEVRRWASDLHSAAAVITFDPHPAYVVRPDSAPLLLTDLEQRLELLAEAGVDRTLVVRFDQERARETAADFVSDVLVGCLHTRAVVVGHDFHFGYKRQGNVPFLVGQGAEHGFDVLGLHLTGDGDDAVSSTRIRRLLAEGDVGTAATLLGRPHEVRGAVEHGDARGRELGFPTANVHVPGVMQLPADGVYAGWYARPDGTTHAACISLGRRPTFYEEQGDRLLEPYLLDVPADTDLYGERARVRFAARLRGQARFDSVDALVTQMHEDVRQTREVLAGYQRA